MRLPDRILDGFKPEGDCLIWTRAKNTDGYGVTFFEGKSWRVHRLMFTAFTGPIPSGLTLDHLCRNRACGHPDHLEPVTSAVNTMRGDAGGAINAAKTHCLNGHELAGENLYEYQWKGKTKRACKICKAARAKRDAPPPKARPRKTHCHRGHLYAYRRPNGAPVCLACQVIWDRVYRTRKKE